MFCCRRRCCSMCYSLWPRGESRTIGIIGSEELQVRLPPAAWSAFVTALCTVTAIRNNFQELSAQPPVNGHAALRRKRRAPSSAGLSRCVRPWKARPEAAQQLLHEKCLRAEAPAGSERDLADLALDNACQHAQDHAPGAGADPTRLFGQRGAIFREELRVDAGRGERSL